MWRWVVKNSCHLWQGAGLFARRAGSALERAARRRCRLQYSRRTSCGPDCDGAALEPAPHAGLRRPIRYNRSRKLRTSTLRNPDRRFFDGFMLVLGILIGVAVAPVGQVALADSEERGATQTEPTSTPEAAASPLTGPQVYNAVCIACHGAPGVGGAPALGDGDAWAARIAQGMDTLIDHALHGLSGSTGVMPRKGGRVDFSDEEIIGAVEYMVEQVAQ